VAHCRTVWRTDLGSTPCAITRGCTPIAAEFLSSPALSRSTPMKGGWWRDTVRIAGKYSWATFRERHAHVAGCRFAAVRRCAALWTRHYGSTFTPQQHGIIQFSGDSGATWSDVAMILGDGRTGYPMRVELRSGGRPGARVRFISEHFYLVARRRRLRGRTPAPRSTSLRGARRRSLRKTGAEQSGRQSPGPPRPALPASRSTASTGERLYATTVPAPTNEYVWTSHWVEELGAWSNGAYIIVVDVDGHRYRRRLFVARPAP